MALNWYGVKTVYRVSTLGRARKRDKGYDHVALHFASPNIQGAAFWQSSGFRPVEYGMRRHIDERVAWANR